MLNSEKVFSESFENYTDEKQAYSVRSEPTHKYTNHDAIVENQALHIKRNHSKQLLIMPEVYDFEFTYPDLNEQKKISDYLDEKCADIDKLIEIKKQKIDQLDEYKKSLIYEYVTGKKEVC